MPRRFSVARIALLGLLAISSGGCTYIYTGARSTLVMLVRDEITAPNSPPLPQPTRAELKSMLAEHFLWLADDKQAAKWIAYVAVRTPPTPLQPFGLTLIELKRNPDWQPHSSQVSSPIKGGDSPGTTVPFNLDR